MHLDFENDKLRKLLVWGGAAAAGLVLILIGWVIFAIQSLPNYKQLSEYRPPITTRVYAGDGSLIAEFAREQRVFVPIEEIPDHVKNAFLSAEDKSFYEHGGIDYAGLARATLVNMLSIFTGDRMQGASTITQQVAKNMLLTSDRTVTRKVKEAFLAQRIEKAFSKDRILELYLNEIYLGQRAYGVAAASLNYFNKPLDKLTIAESAYLGALPKGPNNYHPIKRKARAIARRNWVIDRMADNGFITKEQAQEAKQDDLVTTDRLSGDAYVVSHHFVEELRREVEAVYGKKKLYDDGLSIRSTLDVRLQVAAAKALRTGLEQYDRRHGWRGALDRLAVDNDVIAALKKVPAKLGQSSPADWEAVSEDLAQRVAKAEAPPMATDWKIGVVVAANAKGASVVYPAVKGEQAGLVRASLLAEDAAWANAAAGAVKKKDEARLKPGALVYVAPAAGGKLALKQEPAVEGAFLAMDVNTGRVLAMVGGYNFSPEAQFNHATQAKRQPGSSFKPFVYAAALEYGFTPATLVEDAPFELKQADGTIWSPENYEKGMVYGPQTLRRGLEQSRNLMTIRLAYEIGMDKVFDVAKRLDVYTEKTAPNCADGPSCSGYLSFSIGAGETTLLRLVRGYASFVNGGKKVQPTLVDRIQDRDGKSVFRYDRRQCPTCSANWSGQAPPVLADERLQLVDPIIAYQLTSMLEGVVERGTGAAIKSVGKPLAGKTGTTDDYSNAWFIGFSPDIAAGVWVGFDKPTSLGDGESGGRLAAPIFRDFMADALKDEAGAPFRAAQGVRFVTIDADAGTLPGPATTRVIQEAFRPGSEPTRDGGPPRVIGADAQIDSSALGDLSGLFTQDGPGAQTAPGAPTSADGQTPREELGGIY